MTRVLVSDRVLEAQTGGNTTYARNVYARLPENGIDVIVAKPPLNGAHARRAVYAIWEGLALPGSRADASLIHYPADTGAMFKTSLPIVATIHGVAAAAVPGLRRPLPERVWMARARRLARVATRLITVSRASANDLERWLRLPAGSFKVIPHGVDHGRFHPIPIEAARARVEHLELPERFFLYLGNIEPRKNLLALLRALEEPVLRSHGVPLVVAGKPAWDAGPILEAVDRAPLARYVGRVDDEHVAALMVLARAFVFPSLYEGFGLPVLEAMACGTPTVAADIAALREVADGAAYLADPANPSVFAAAIAHVITDGPTRRELAAAGVQRASAFDWAASASAHADVFHDVSSAQRRGHPRRRLHVDARAATRREVAEDARR